MSHTQTPYYALLRATPRSGTPAPILAVLVLLAHPRWRQPSETHNTVKGPVKVASRTHAVCGSCHLRHIGAPRPLDTALEGVELPNGGL